MPGVSLGSISFVGDGLERAECVLTTAAGEVFCSDRACGVVQLGRPKLPLEGKPPALTVNGFALLRSREFLVANIDPSTGSGVWKIDRGRRIAPWVMRADGEDLPVTNAVCIDARDRAWISVSSRRVPREDAFRPGEGDGFIVLADQAGARIVADKIGFANEARVHPGGQWLYVNETFARRLARFPITPTGLGAKEIVCSFDAGEFPDGITFDAAGHAWVSCVVSNRIIRVAPDGAKEIVVDASDPAIVAAAERNYLAGVMGRADVDSGARCLLGNASSLAFGGPDLRQVYVGSLGNSRLATFRSPVAGAIPPHWHF
jgi:hypothetical protein